MKCAHNPVRVHKPGRGYSQPKVITLSKTATFISMLKQNK